MKAQNNIVTINLLVAIDLSFFFKKDQVSTNSFQCIFFSHLFVGCKTTCVGKRLLSDSLMSIRQKGACSGEELLSGTYRKPAASRCS
jgi:hypothetical protein